MSSNSPSCGPCALLTGGQRRRNKLPWPQLAAQDDEVLFDLSAFFMNLEAKKRKEFGGRPSGSGDVPMMAQRQAPAGQDVEPVEVPHFQFKLGYMVNMGDGEAEGREERSVIFKILFAILKSIVKKCLVLFSYCWKGSSTNSCVFVVLPRRRDDYRRSYEQPRPPLLFAKLAENKDDHKSGDELNRYG